jgi:hypothetical protein
MIEIEFSEKVKKGNSNRVAVAGSESPDGERPTSILL